ncbi:MAG: class II fructose-1,6-bisphosphate aldolase [Clostridiales bacterium]|nr:class II fructose-1,6-bisphosphate aldolase [Clostridiales bacterium]
MMIVNAKKMLKEARDNGKCIAHFNINNLEWTKYILEKCNELQKPVILGVSEGAIKYMGGYNVVSHLVYSLVKDLNISIDVCLHLDHGSSVESCKKAIDSGFSSVMIDASKYSLEENINITKEVVEYAHSKNITVEAEVGHIGGVEDGIASGVLVASLDDCIKFVKETKVDMLAPAIGSVHGVYKGEPKLDFELLTSLKNNINIPLVLHGGSGIPEDKIIKAIKLGISKININTELQQAWHEGVLKFVENKKEVYDPRKIISSGEENLKNIVEYKLSLME